MRGSADSVRKAQRRSQVAGQRRGDVHRRPCDGVREGQARGVQELAVQPEEPGRAVLRVTRHRVADGQQVGPDLVRATGLEPDSKQRVTSQKFLDLEVRRRFTRLVRVERMARWVGPVAPDRCLDPPAPRARPPADEREVRSLELPAPDEISQAAVGLRRPRNHEQAGRVAVESVHDAGPLGVVATGRSTREQTVHERAVGVSRRRMNDHTRRLVHDEKVLVLEGHAQVDVLGLQRVGLRFRQLDLERLAAREPSALGSRSAVEADRAGADQPLGCGTRADLRALGEEAVEPGAGRVVWNAQPER
jgi:hypothetical protein